MKVYLLMFGCMWEGCWPIAAYATKELCEAAAIEYIKAHGNAMFGPLEWEFNKQTNQWEDASNVCYTSELTIQTELGSIK